MQNEQYRLAPSLRACPARESCRLRDCHEKKQSSGAVPIRRCDPSNKRKSRERDRTNIEAVERCRSSSIPLSRQPVTGETRDDAAADYHDQAYNRRNSETKTISWGG